MGVPTASDALAAVRFCHTTTDSHPDGRRSLSGQSGSQTLPHCQLGPAETRENGASHDPIFVLLGQERQFLSEVGNALLVGGLGEAVGDIGPPIATLRTVGVEQPAYVRGEIAKRIGFG